MQCSCTCKLATAGAAGSGSNFVAPVAPIKYSLATWKSNVDCKRSLRTKCILQVGIETLCSTFAQSSGRHTLLYLPYPLAMIERSTAVEIWIDRAKPITKIGFAKKGCRLAMVPIYLSVCLSDLSLTPAAKRSKLSA